MMASSVINLILSIFGISVSSLFILFWCGRFLCAHFLLRRSPQAGALLLPRTATNRRVERNSTGVNPLVIAYFPTLRFNEDMFPSRQDAMCAVCLGEYKEDELLRCLPQCGHTFHVNCIDAWLQQHATCPVCRMSLQGYFVGRLMPRLPPMPLPNDQLGGGLTSVSEQSEALSSDLQPVGGNVMPVDISTHENSLSCNGACSCEVTGSTVQLTPRHVSSNDTFATERLDSRGEDVGPNCVGERS